jgi:alkylmercury lyase
VNHSSLALLALKLAAHLDCTQDVACQHIMQSLVETGQPVSPMHLAMRLQMSQRELAAHLRRYAELRWRPETSPVL